MELEGTAFDRVVENTRTEHIRKGGTRRRRASIGMNVVEREWYGSKQRERNQTQVACLDLIPDSMRIFLVAGDGADDV